MLGAPMGELDLQALVQRPLLQAVGALVLALVCGLAISTAIAGVLARAVARSHRDLDRRLLALVRRPVGVTAVVVALVWVGEGVIDLSPEEAANFKAALGTIAVVVWMAVLVRAADEVRRALQRSAGSGIAGLEWLRGRATGLVHFMVRTAVLLVGLYVLMVMWQFDLRPWQISLGVAGAVLGLAAQDSLDNMLGGVFIAGDSPLQIGDVIEVEAGLRGRVTDIGWRSTRILTRDGVEVNIPNARLGVGRVVNESAGPRPAVRIACAFRVEHGRPAEQVRGAVVPGAAALADIEGEPVLQFLGATPAGLRFVLLAHVVDPDRRLEAQDALNSHILAGLRAAKIALAYPTHEVHPGGPLAAALQAKLLSGHVHSDMSI